MKVFDKEKLVKDPLVSVRVHAFQQELWVRECLDSILSQKTNFQFEIVIGNNPSSDSTRDILKEYQCKYPEKIVLLLHEENIGFLPNFFETGYSCRGKYIARCDGDDYWCDPFKLQKQVDLLESDSSIGMCFTSSKEYYEDNGSFVNVPLLRDVRFASMLLREPMQTLTIMHRRELYEKYLLEIEPQKKCWLMEDTPINLWYSVNSKIARIDDVTAVYRIVSGSISHEVNYSKQEKFNKSILDIRLFFYDNYNVNDEALHKKIINDYYRRNINASYEAKNLKMFMVNVWNYKFDGFHTTGRHILQLMKLFVKEITNK